MKKVCLIMAVVMLGFVALVSAQKPFAGTVKMHSHIEGTEDPNLLSQGESDYSIQLFGNYTKTVVSQEGFGFTTITNGDAKTAVYIIEIMGMGKYYYELPAEKIQDAIKNTKFEYTKTGEKKTIAGYEAEKVVVTATDLETDESKNFVVYISSTLNTGSDINFMETPGLAGYPMRTEVTRDIDGTEVTIITEAVEIIPSKKIKQVDFLMPADVQDIHTNPQLMKMMGLGGDDEEDED